MVDVVVASALVAAGVLAVNRRLSSSDPPGALRSPTSEAQSDLPCPWCRAPTREDDDHCPSCRQRFG